LGKRGGNIVAIIDVVKYNGGPDVFAWKFPNEELSTMTQVIVNESQEAVLLKGGQALDVLGPGRHTLQAANIPILNKLINLPFGGKSPFTAEIWYINRIHSLDIKWGTPTPIQLQDPEYKVFLPVRAFGQFGVQVVEPKKFLVKLIGTTPVFDKSSLMKIFRGLYLTKAKDAIASYLVNKNVSVMKINASLLEISEHLKEAIRPTLEDYGLDLLNFYVNNINVPEDDPAVMKLKAALAKRAEMNIVGYNYAQERSFDTMEGAANNAGSSGGIMNAGIGMAMGVHMGDAMGRQAGMMTQKTCTGCNGSIDANMRFCPLCGNDTSKTAPASDNTTCSKCGESFSKRYKFCPGCSAPYTPCSACGEDMKPESPVCPTCGATAPKPCPNCGKNVSGNHKFCPECGGSLVKKCGECGVVIEGNHKFCPECGNKI